MLKKAALNRSARHTTARAAELISGGEVPEWLQPGLERIIRRVLAPAIAARKAAQSRADVADEIKKVVQAVSVLLRNLGAQSAVGVELAGGGPGPAMEEDEEIRDALLGLKARSGRALMRLRKGGRGKIEYGDSPEEICATTVMIACHCVQGKFPPPASKTAWEVANLIWQLAGGETTTYNYVPSAASRWRPHLKSVLQSSNKAERLSPNLALLQGRIWQILDPPRQ